MRTSVLAVLTATMVVTSVPVGSSAEPAPSPPDTVDWGACTWETPLPGLQCGTLQVPLDYRSPNGETIDIAMSRLASASPEKRRGVLVTNAGGPGGPGLNFPLILKYLGIPQSVLDSYDIIGFDPRGVGYSTPVTCDLELEESSQTANIPEFALNPGEVAERAERMAGIAEQCGSSATASILPHITTANTARDMDRIRVALGERTISYLGVSYGTYLGSVYATLFPRRGDRIVLDSALGPDGADIEASRGFGRGFEDSFPDFAAFVADRPEYGLGRTQEQVRAKYFELAARLDRTPRPDGVDGKRFRKSTLEGLYLHSQFPALAETWRAVDTGQPLPPPPLPPLDPPADQPFDNAVASQLAVMCNDTDWPESVATYQRNVEIDRVRYPMYGAGGANIWPCAFWPTEPAEPKVPITDDGPSTVLIVQNLRDTSTPLAGARKLRAAFGDRARMVTADQGGHLAYLILGNQCLNDTTTNFLLTGKLPRQDIACGRSGGQLSQ
ncbi:alpha/beta hydrolase [Actinophytocola sediminis]